MDDIMLPGFRFHPTDEELVGFYLKAKIQQRTLSIELIKPLDIYKYDPWDLPKFASGEKEWYFYCPRDRKYKNSARPNRVTGAGFWKATGTDRPIYSSEGSKCIGLKKSLVFYKGRAAKGIKTDWMMHEFRLPSTTKPNDSWAICRIFKKVSSATKTALSHSWVSPLLPEISTSGVQPEYDQHFYSTTMFNSNNHISTPTCLNTYNVPHPQITNFSPFDQVDQVASGMISSTSNAYNLNLLEGLDYSEMQALHDSDSFSTHLTQENLEEIGIVMKESNVKQYDDDQWENLKFNFDMSSSMEFPFGFLNCDSSSPCPSEISASYSTNKTL